MLYIVRGLPGSGKSTYAKKNFPGMRHFEADMYLCRSGTYVFNPSDLNAAHRWCKNSTFQNLSKGRDVVVSNTFVQAWEMEPYLQMAHELKVPVTIIELQTKFENIHGVPEAKLKIMSSKWASFKELEEEVSQFFFGILDGTIKYEVVLA